jgi:hypothetical protein
MLINNDTIATNNTWTLKIYVRITLRGARLNRKIFFLAKRGNIDVEGIRYRLEDTKGTKSVKDVGGNI